MTARLRTSPNTPATGNVITGAGGGTPDSDPDGDPLTVTRFAIDANGVGTPEAFTAGPDRDHPWGGHADHRGQRGVHLHAGGQLRRAGPGATYTISDGTATDTATLTLDHVTNTPPVATDDGPIRGPANTQASGNVLTGGRRHCPTAIRTATR